MAYNRTKAALTAKPIFWLSFLILLILGVTTPAYAQGKFYRYINDEGVKVISHSIPPKYVPKGYEIINQSGYVIQVVPPALDPEDLKADEAQREKERALLAEYEILARRYSTESEIYAARDRRLAHLNANIAIINSNITSLKNQIDDLMSKAASYERGGRNAPNAVLDNLREVRAELASTEEMLQARVEERDELHGKFEADVTLFRRGKKLIAEKENKTAVQAQK